MTSLTINDKNIEIEEGLTILEAAESADIRIPTLCAHKALSPYGACRLCLVEITQNGRSMIQSSCTYPALEGLVIQTDSERVIKARKMMIELLLARCPDAEDVKELAKELGVEKTRIKPKNKDCTLCGLCVRMCQERMGRAAISFVGRGSERKVMSPFGTPNEVCQACGACDFICPTGIIDLSELSKNEPIPIPFEHNEALVSRPAIYISYPQAIPNKPSIDPRYCVHMLRGECEICKEFCEADAIDYEQEEEKLDLNVGSVILSPGYKLFNTNEKLEYGYWQYPNVITALEFERTLSASGPYAGEVMRPSDKRSPKKIAFIQCVGSRDDERNYCSSVCCMYATKEAIIAKEHVGEELECNIFYMDVRAFGKGFEEYYERAKGLGVKYIRCRPSSIEEVDGHNLRIQYVTDDGRALSEEYDMVVLSAGLRPPNLVNDISQKFGIELNEHGFCRTEPFKPVASSKEGIYVCGLFTEPKDIPETVIQASGAASEALALLSEVRGTLIEPKEYPPEKDVTGQLPRIGVFICHCGTNIAGVVDVPEVVEYAKTLPDVVYVENNLYACANDTQDNIKELIEEHNLNRVIIASCTPRTHEPLFRDTIREAGLNPYLFEMANIRDQCSWTHTHEPEKATEKAKDLVRMAVAKARLIEPLFSISMPINNGALVIGGGISGMTAALNLANQGFGVNLVEREEELGGHLRHIHYLLSEEDPQEELGKTIQKVNNHPQIKVWTGAEIDDIEGFIGNFKTKIKQNGTEAEVEHGAIIVATGAKAHTPTEYMYGEDEKVITQSDLEEKLASLGGKVAASRQVAGFIGVSEGKGDKGEFDAKRVVMIQCVGSREEDRMYCSRVCCSQAIKNAIKIKEDYPDTDVFILYREVRTYGFRERYYTEARRKGIRFVRYEVEQKPTVSTNDDRLRIETKDPILGSVLQIDTDLLVLAPAIVPQDDVEDIAQMLKVPLTKDRFFLEAHMKLRPVDFSVEGVFLAGMAHAPKNLDEAIAQAEAAASRASTILSKTEYVPEAITASVDEEVCAACGVCVSICSFDAPEIVTVKGGKHSQINTALCKACGACATACPSGAVQQLGFRPKQITDMISAALD